LAAADRVLCVRITAAFHALLRPPPPLLLRLLLLSLALRPPQPFPPLPFLPLSKLLPLRPRCLNLTRMDERQEQAQALKSSCDRRGSVVFSPPHASTLQSVAHSPYSPTETTSFFLPLVRRLSGRELYFFFLACLWDLFELL
jgi:hypothetical protein